MDIFVGNLNFRMEEDQLEQLFAEFGEVSSVRIMKDKITGRARGFGFVSMPNESEADAAITSLDGREIQGRPLRVNKAEPSNREKRF